MPAVDGRGRDGPLRVLFLCSANSCRSRMAEAFARRLKAGLLEVASAGTRPGPLDPRAAQVMREVGIELSPRPGRHLGELAGRGFDYVVTLCERAREECPVFPGARHVHVDFPDPRRFAGAGGGEEEILARYRKLREEIRAFVAGLPGTLEGAGT